VNFYLIGINYKTAPSDVRELAYKNRQQIEKFCRHDLSGQAAVLFTCNRMEIYGVSTDRFAYVNVFYKLKQAYPKIFSWAYLKENTHKTIRHSLRLACGLESQIVGEGQIVDQLRLWVERKDVPQILRDKWKLILLWAQDIRLLSGIEDFKKDIADFTLDDLHRRLSSVSQKKTQRMKPDFRLHFEQVYAL